MSLIRLLNLNLLNKTIYSRSMHTKSIQYLLDIDSTKLTELDKHKIRCVGWVKSFRDQKEIKFINITDGSDSRTLQLVLEGKNLENKQEKDYEKIFSSINFNTSIEVEGYLVQSTHKKQNVELQVTNLNIVHECDPSEYPFKPKIKHTFEQIRPHVHLRSHIDLFASVMRFRSELTMNIHDFFHRHKFTQIHTPVITSNNCEGGCETFQVTSNDKDHELTMDMHTKFNQENDNDKIDQTNMKYFFSKPAYLTASAQLHLETMTSSLGNVYTLSPTFRAEKSLTRHHLAEFYMLEAELIDMNNLEQILDFVELFLKDISLNTYNKFNKNDLDLIINSSNLNNKNKKPNDLNHVEFLKSLLTNKTFIRLTYKEAIDILNNLLGKKKYTNLTKKKIEYGEDLNKEQEKLLVDHFEQVPVFVTNYPKSLKPFYMRENLNNKELVDNFDLLAPKVGEIIGGSLREYRLDLLSENIKKQNLDLNLFKYYLETKKFGSMKMGGWGLGLERLIQFLINIENIRDTCAFPRSLYNCKM